MLNVNQLQITTDPPVHVQTEYANKNLDWIPGDSFEKFNKHCQDTDKVEYLTQSGWDKPGCFTYNFNSNGFRTDELVYNPVSIVGLGCSHTLGHGLPQERVWVEILGKKLHCPVYNLGVIGCSLDTVFRIATYWLPIIKPKYVVLNCPEYERFECRSNKNDSISLTPGILEWMSDEEATVCKRWWLNDENSLYNGAKNVLAIENICQQHNIKFFAYSPNEMERKFDKARDFCHRGPACHESFANRIYTDIRNINE